MILGEKISEISEKTNKLLDQESLPKFSETELAREYKNSTEKLTTELQSSEKLVIDTKSIINDTGDNNELRNSKSVRTHILKKVSENILQKDSSDITSGLQNKILNKILLSQMKLIDQLTKIITKDKKSKGEKYDTKSWKVLKKDYEYQYRRTSLFESSDEEQFEADLKWMEEQGKGEDLISILKVKSSLPFTSENIVERITEAEKEICNREKKKGTIFGKYRVFVNQNTHVEQLCPTVKLELAYPAFSVVLATEETFLELKAFYPIEQLYQFNSPFELIEQFQKSENIEKNGIVHYLVVKFDVPIPSNWKELIRNTQAEVIQAIGRSEVVIYAENEEITNRIRNIPQVREISQHQPTIQVQPQYLRKKSDQPVSKAKIAEARLQAARNRGKSRKKNIPIPGILIASFFTEEARNNAAEHLEHEGIRIADKLGNTKLVLDVNTYSNPLESLSIIGEQQGLRSLEEKILPTLFNDKACNVIEAEISCSGFEDDNLSLTGEGEIIAVTDTGIDTGDTENIHPDFQGRVLNIENMPAVDYETEFIKGFYYEDEASDRHSGHGTHVAGSIVGDGQYAQQMKVEASAIPKGIAPKAELVFQAVEKTPKWTSDAINTYLEETGDMPPIAGLWGIPNDLKKLFSKTYNQGARIHSNSWGNEVNGVYDQKCVDLDQFVWKHKDFLVIVAAGNSGRHSFSGVPGVDQGSVASPAVAKNCLTVGASENNHDGKFQDTYGKRNPEHFPYSPYNDDNMADHINDLAAFSSRGPCQDGRCKPDLVAPGTFILSTRSSQIANNNYAEGYYSPAQNHYMYMSGTSMATPLVAGCAAKVREYLRKIENIERPSAALIKAMLIHSAQYIKYRYAHPNSAPWADHEQGWGRICLKTVLDPELPTKVIFVDQEQGLSNEGKEHTYQVEVIDNSVLLRVTLVYTDFPGEEGKVEHLVNNLNLILYPPTDKHRRYYLGNDFKNTGDIDNCNNVEGCIIEPPEVQTGSWIIKVVGADVSEAPQDYALVISGGIDPSNFKQVS